MAATWVFNIVLPLIPVFLFVYVWLFNFIDGLPLRALALRLSSHQGRMHLLMTAFSFGFLKSSFRRCKHYFYRALVNPLSRVTVGQPLRRECTITCLATGKETLLSSLLASAGDKPIILTFGSWS